MGREIVRAFAQFAGAHAGALGRQQPPRIGAWRQDRPYGDAGAGRTRSPAQVALIHGAVRVLRGHGASRRDREDGGRRALQPRGQNRALARARRTRPGRPSVPRRTLHSGKALRLCQRSPAGHSYLRPVQPYAASVRERGHSPYQEHGRADDRLLRRPSTHRQSIRGPGRSHAQAEACKVQVFKHRDRPVYGVQFDPTRYDEAHPDGKTILLNFLRMAGKG